MPQLKISEALASRPADPLAGSEGLYVLQDGQVKGATVGQFDALRQWLQLLEPASAAGALDLDLVKPAGFAVTLTEDITTLTFSNLPASRFIEFTVAWTQDAAGSWDVTFPASVQNPPTIAPTAGAVTITRFATWDGGATIHTLLTV